MITKQYTKEQISEVVEELNQGSVVAFPTDTVYGVAVRYDSEQAIQKLKEAKGRPETKPFPFMVSKIEQIEKIAVLQQRDYQLIKKWFPGAMTFLFLKTNDVKDTVTNGFQTIAIRMPDDEFILELIDKVGAPLLVTSANLSGGENTSTTEEVLQQLEGRIEAIVVGQSGGKQPSTIIDATDKELKVIRQGAITLEEVEKSLKEDI